jgi:hypothetical protein
MPHVTLDATPRTWRAARRHGAAPAITRKNRIAMARLRGVTFLAAVGAAGGVPTFVEREFRQFSRRLGDE